MAETALDGILSTDMGVVVPRVEDMGVTMQCFKSSDYVVFGIMLLTCVGIGAYFGIYRRPVSTQDYLMGSRKMTIIPVTLSLIASLISGVAILGIPTETYLYGLQYVYILIGLPLMALILNYVYLPVFYRLKLTSIYEYLERRFDERVKLFASLLFVISTIKWLSIVTYVPVLALNQVSGLNVYWVTPVVYLICIFYTALGGLKAVVWTDTVQAAVMFGAMVLVAVKGTQDIGGLETVVQHNMNGGRIKGPNLTFDSIQRYTLWSLTIGGCVHLLEMAAVNQSMLQRYMSLPSLKAARRATWMFSCGLCLMVLVCGYCGILIYATFHQCDPLKARLAKEKVELLPLLVMRVLGDYSCLPGIFVAGIFSASLSSLSSGLNAISAVVLEDFYPSFFKTPLTEKQGSLLMKLTVVTFGLISIALLYIIEHVGGVLQLSFSIGSITGGPSLGIFTMGVLLPWVNAKGALTGGMSSLAVMCWLCYKAQLAIVNGELSFPEKEISTEGCHHHFIPGPSITAKPSNATDPTNPFIFYHVSYLWYTLIGSFISIVVGISTSLIMKQKNPHNVDVNLLSPLIRRFVKSRDFQDDTLYSVIYAYQRHDSKDFDVTISQFQNLREEE